MQYNLDPLGNARITYNVNGGVITGNIGVTVLPTGRARIAGSASWMLLEARANAGADGYNVALGIARKFPGGKFFAGIGYDSVSGNPYVAASAGLDYLPYYPSDTIKAGPQIGGTFPIPWLGDLFRSFMPPRDPLVIDLNSTGISLTAFQETNAAFDFDGNGLREYTGWVHASDGLIVADLDASGAIDSLLDLFGSGAGDSLATLATFDMNNDMIINSQDSIFLQLRVWQDGNSDGIAQVSELASFSEAGIQSVSLSAVETNTEVKGNVIARVASANLTGGRSVDVASVFFDANPTVTVGTEPGFIYNPDVIDKPNLRGYGDVSDLWKWASTDVQNLTILEQALSDLSQAETVTSLVGRVVEIQHLGANGGGGYTEYKYELSAFEEFLGKWAGIGPSHSESSAPIAIAEAFVGRPIENADIGNRFFYSRFQEFTAGMAVRLLAQIHSQPIGAGLIELTRTLAAGPSIDLSTATDAEAAAWTQMVAPKLDHVVPDTLAGSLAGLGYSSVHDAFYGDVVAALANALKLGDFVDPADGWDAVRQKIADDPFLFSAIDRSTIERGAEISLLDRAIRLASENRLIPVFAGNYVSWLGTAAADVISADGLPGTSALIDGVNGNDSLNGGMENTTYVIRSSMGNTTINDLGGVDEIFFADQQASLVQLNYDDQTNTAFLQHSGGLVTINSFLDSVGNPKIEAISSSDGLVADSRDIRSAIIRALSSNGDDSIAGFASSSLYETKEGDDTISAGGEDDWLYAGPGDDTLHANAGDDTLNGGRGNDTMMGGPGDDTYVFVRGDGQDVVSEYTQNAGGTDIVVLGENIAMSDILVTQSDTGNDIILRINGTTDQITLDNTNNVATGYHVEQVRFFDGTTWSLEELLVMATRGTPGDDALYGSSNADDDLSGGAGDDHLEGAGGNDRFAGGTGIDTMQGGSGNDTYVFARGDGHDVVSEYAWGSGGVDTLLFGTGIAPSDISIAQTDEGNDFVLRISGTTDQVTLDNTNNVAAGYQIERVAFADGTVWSLQQVFGFALLGSDGDDVLYGSDAADTLTGREGNDHLNGAGGDDILDGGIGDDTSFGGGGDDVYIFARGDGHDVISEYAWGSGGVDTLLFGTGIAPSDISIAQTDEGNDFVLRISGTTDQVTLDNTNNVAAGYQIERVAFADGTVWSSSDLLNAITPGDADPSRIEGTVGDDSLTGTDGDDTLVGGQGNDLLFGGAGSDTYIYASGDGNDQISDINSTGSTDVLKLSDRNAAGVELTRGGNHLYVKDMVTGSSSIVWNQFDGTGAGIEQITFADGSSWDRVQIQAAAWLRGGGGSDEITGSEGADTFFGELGDDRLNGGGGSDTFVYRSGDGSDFVYDTSGAGDVDALKLSDLNPAGVAMTRGGNHLYVTDVATGSVSTVWNQFDGTGAGVEQIIFADGSSWDRVQIQAAAWLRGGGGSDEINGSEGGDTFFGGLGDDRLNGGGGSDTFVYRSGDGADFVYDTSGVGDVDTLKLPDLNAAGIELTRGGNYLYVKDIATGSVSTVWNQFDGSGAGVEQITFADGSSWDRAQIQAAAWLRGSGGSDEINGSEGADTFFGGLGDDRLNGGGGSDAFVYRSGDGADFVYETSGAGDVDTLKLPDLNAAGIELTRGGNHLYVKDIATGSTSTVWNQFDGSGAGVEQITFANGTSWNRAQIQAAAWLRGGGGSDEINGSEGADTFFGALGDDRLNGGGGSDTFVYRSGDGADFVYDTSGATDIDTLKLPDLAAAVIEVSRGGNHLYVKDIATGSSSIVWNQFDGTGAGVERIEFSDSTDWDRDQILVAAGTTDLDDIVTGTTKDDWLRGKAGDDHLDGIGGADHILGDEGNDVLIGGDGEDTLIGGVGDDDLSGGAGNDQLSGGQGSDTAQFRGLQSAYQLTTSNGVITVTDLAPLGDGDDGTDVLTGVETLQFNDSAVSLAAPIVLDLNGDGVTLIDRNRSKAKFDWDSDGTRDKTGWVGKSDGLLVYDRNGDGKVSGANELSFIDDKPGAKSDLDGLSAFDSDGDGSFSSADEKFGSFRVWRDKDGDGKVDKKELQTLNALGIASISLQGQATEQTWQWDDNLTINTGSFTWSDGRVGVLGDVALNYASKGGSGGSESALPSQRAASRLIEAMSAFSEGSSTDVLTSRDWQERRDAMFAAPSAYV